MKKIFTLAAIALFTLASCSDNDATPTTPEENVVLLKKTIENDVDGDFTTTYAYDGTKLTGINYSDGTYDAITYTGDLITQWVEYYEDGSTHTKFIYEGTNAGVNFIGRAMLKLANPKGNNLKAVHEFLQRVEQEALKEQD